MHELLDECADLPLLTIESGACLIEQGQPPGPLYFLVSGELTIERDGVPFARIDASGAIFGEMSAILDRPATATVRARVPTTVRTAEDGMAFLGDHPSVSLAVARTVASRLDNLTRYLTDVKQQFADQAGHLGMVDDVLTTLVHHQAPPARPGSARMPELEY